MTAQEIGGLIAVLLAIVPLTSLAVFFYRDAHRPE